MLPAYRQTPACTSSSLVRKNAAILKALRKALIEAPEDLFATIQKALVEDFGSRIGGPGEAGTQLPTFRGWVEHRSRIPNIPSSARMAWGISGALDSLVAGRPNEANTAYGTGNRSAQVCDSLGYVINSEQPRQPHFTRQDSLEWARLKAARARWVEAFVSNVKDQEDYIERRDRLGRRKPFMPPESPNEAELARAKAKAKAEADAKGGGKGKAAETARRSESYELLRCKWRPPSIGQEWKLPSAYFISVS